MKQRYDVLIVGLGPVGAVLAGLLAEYGLSVAVVERSTEVYPLPRAAHFDHEIMRIFQRLGIADEVLRHARPAGRYEFRNAKGELLMLARRGDERGISGWAYSYMFNQPGVELALRAKLANMANVSVALGASFVGLRTFAEHVEVEVSTGDGDGGSQLYEARYVVGCDGAWSPVREALGTTLEDYQFDEPWLVVDTIPSDPKQLPTANLQICDPARPTTCVLMGPGRHRWEFMLLPGEDADTVMQPGFVEDLLRQWNVDVTMERRAVYRFHGLIAEDWRSERVIIAGDAAHQMPPFAGQGMCSGIRDAANLAWKLAAVLAGRAAPRLLDTYQAERERSVRDYIELAIEMGRVVCTLDEQRAAQRDAEMIAALKSGSAPAPARAGAPGKTGGAFMADNALSGTIFPQFVNGDQRLDDALSGDAWLIDATGGDEPDVLHIASTDPRIAPFQDELRRWLETNSVEAVLVRPDRYIFGTGAPGDLLDHWRAEVVSPVPAVQSAA